MKTKGAILTAKQIKRKKDIFNRTMLFNESGAYIGRELKPEPKDIETLAAKVADQLRDKAWDNDGNRVPVTVHVFPVKKSGRGHSSDFRRILAARLLGMSGDGFWNCFTLDEARIRMEESARARGFIFEEVNPADY